MRPKIKGTQKEMNLINSRRASWETAGDLDKLSKYIVAAIGFVVGFKTLQLQLINKLEQLSRLKMSFRYPSSLPFCFFF